MSGPKLSQAEIERMRQERLEKERLAALKRLRDAQSQYREMCNHLNVVRSNTKESLDRIGTVYRADIESSISRILSGLTIANVADEKNPESYQEATDKMAASINAVSVELGKVVGKAAKRADNDKTLTDANSVYQSFKTVVDTVSKELTPVKIDFKSDYDLKRLRSEIELLYSHFFAMSARGDAPSLQKYAKSVTEKLKPLLGENAMQINRAEMIRELQKIINDEQELIRQWNERKSLYDDYYALAIMTDNTPKNPADFVNVELLRNEIKRLGYLNRKRDEMDYIADQINDAMVDLGYSLVTSRVLIKKDQGETDFSLYKADEQAGIAVYTDQSGAVMMRMTVLGDDPVITEEDREFSYQRQIDFCAGHPDLVAALADRGVFLKQKSYQEPDRRHTYKIDMSGKGTVIRDSVVRQDNSNQKINRRRRRHASSKKVRAM